jgi:hypothetical protein
MGKVIRVTGRARVFPSLFATVSRAEFGYDAVTVQTMAEAEAHLAEE